MTSEYKVTKGLVFRTRSFDDSNPRAARKGRKPLHPLLSENIETFEEEIVRRKSWHTEELKGTPLNLGRNGHTAPLVIITSPDRDRHEGRENGEPEEKEVEINSETHKNCEEKGRRPSLVSRNLKKIFKK